MGRGQTLTTVLCAPVLLAGCPLILGGPDLSNVDRPTDTDATTATDADTDTLPTTGPTGDTASTDGSLAPLIIEMSALPLVDQLGFSFVVADSDGDLLGGTVELTDGQITETLSIPTDLVRFDQDGVSSAGIDATGLYGCDLPYVGAWDMVVTDLAGRSSAPMQAQVQLATRGLLPSPYDLGTIDPPTLFCVEFTTVSYVPGSLQRVTFQVPETGSYTIQMGWPGQTMDADLSLNAEGWDVPLTAITIGPDYETLTPDLEAGVTYRLDVPFYGGQGQPPYQARILIRRN